MSDPMTSPAAADSIIADADDPVFQQEQAHLSEVHAALRRMGRDLAAKLDKTSGEAAQDKKDMADELALNFAGDDEALETAAELATINRVIEAYNISHDVNARKLADVQALLKQPYFAKVVLQFKPTDAPKELYIGNAGIADENYKRLVVDWRSPVAETYYNQENGRTSYHANGRTISADLKLRRQFDISEDVLNYITESRELKDKLAKTQEKIAELDVLAQQVSEVKAAHDGYVVEINVKAGDSYDGKTAALVISSESGDAVLRADTSKIEKKIDKGTQVTVKRDSDKTLTKKVTDSGVNEEGKRYIDVKLTDKDITNLGGGAALFSAAVEMTASYRASSSTTLLPASAVRGSGDSRYVYIVSEESNALGQRVLKVKKQDVKVLSEVGSTVSIQDDLSRQRVAYMEDRAISDGSEVMVYGE